MDTWNVAKNIAIALGKNKIDEISNKYLGKRVFYGTETKPQEPAPPEVPWYIQTTTPFTSEVPGIKTALEAKYTPLQDVIDIYTGIQRGGKPESEVKPLTAKDSWLTGYTENVYRTGVKGIIVLRKAFGTKSPDEIVLLSNKERELGRKLSDEEVNKIIDDYRGPLSKEANAGYAFDVFNQAVIQPLWGSLKIGVLTPRLNKKLYDDLTPEQKQELLRGSFVGGKQITLNEILDIKEKDNPILYQVMRFGDFLPSVFAPTGASKVSRLLGGGELAETAFGGMRLSKEAELRLAREGSEIAKYVDEFKKGGGQLSDGAENFIKDNFQTKEEFNQFLNSKFAGKEDELNTLDDYIQEQVKRSKPQEPGVLQRGSKLLEWYQTNFEDSVQPLRNLIKQAVKKGLEITRANDVLFQIDNVKRAREIANAFMDEQGLTSVVQKLKSWKEYDLFGEYLKAKRSLAEFAQQGPDGKTYEELFGRNYEKDKQIISNYSSRFEGLSNEFREYFRKVAQYMRDASLIDDKQLKGLNEKIDYAPLQRVFDEIENIRGWESGKAGLANISKESVIKKFIGSRRGIVNPIDSAIEMTYRAIREAEVNKASQMIIQMVKDGVLPGTVARDADTVLRRISLSQKISEYVKEIKSLTRKISNRAGWARKLQTELNRLNKKGYDIFSKRTGEADVYVDELAQGRIDKLFASKDKWFEVLLQDVYSDVSPLLDKFAKEFFDTKMTPKQKRDFIRNMSKQQFTDLMNSVVDLPYGQYKRFYNNVLKKNEKLTQVAQEIQNLRDGRELNQVVNNLIKLDPEELQNIRAVLDKKTPILNGLVDEISRLTDNLKEIKEYVRNLRDDLAGLQDVNTKYEGTINGLKNGIKETVIMDRAVTDAVRGLNIEKLNVLNKILKTSIRVAKFAFTGGNVPFVVADTIRNEWQAVLWAKRGLRDSIVNPINLFQTLYEMAGKSDTYMDFLRSGGGETISTAGKETTQTVGKMMASKNLLSKVGYVITNPKEWFGFIEDALASPQAMQKFNFYRTYRKNLIKEGYSVVDADYLATQKSREVLTNFYRSGNIGKVLDSVFVYFNAGIQGAVSLRRLALEDPKKFAIGFTTFFAVPEIVTTLWNISDPERKKAYDVIPEGDKERNFIIVPENPIYDEKTGYPFVISIPKPLGLNNLINPVRKFTLGTYGYNKETAMGIFNELVGTGTSFKLPSQDGGYNTMASQTVPWLTRGLLETAINKNLYTGREIENAEMRALPVSERVNTDTSFTSRQIAQGLQNAGMEISPLMVDNFIRSQFGGVGQMAQYYTDLGLSKFGMAPEKQVGGKSLTQSITETVYRARGGEDIRQIEQARKKEAEQKAVLKLNLTTALTNNDTAKANELLQGLTKQEFNNLVDSIQKDIVREQMTNMQKYLFNRSDAELKNIEASNPQLSNDVKLAREAKEIVKNTTLPIIQELNLQFKPSGSISNTTAQKNLFKGKVSIKRGGTKVKGVKAPKVAKIKVKKQPGIKKTRLAKIKPIKPTRKV